jgi:hypothetical protein
MSHASDLFDAHQRARFMRPDAARWLRPDAARWLSPLHPDELKYSPDQPRDERGRWTDGASSGGATGEAEESAGDTLVQDILAKAQQLKFTGSPADYRRCVNLCYPILERLSPRWSDRNYWDFQKCMNACLGLNR